MSDETPSVEAPTPDIPWCGECRHSMVHLSSTGNFDNDFIGVRPSRIGNIYCRKWSFNGDRYVLSAADMRMFGALCGPTGGGFEPKEGNK